MNFLSSIIGVNLMSPHAIPFAAPIVVASFTGFAIGFAILKLMDKSTLIEKATKRNSHL